MSDKSLGFVKDEIKLFMEKSFQISFGYVGTLLAVVALGNADAVTSLATQFSTTPTYLVLIALLILNVTYVTLASACLFAVLKRGYFILLHSPRNGAHPSTLREWEVFVRTSEGIASPQRFASQLAWNVDNYYMIPFYVLVIASSGTAIVLGFREAAELTETIIVLVLLLCHAVPLVALALAAKLDSKCRRAILRQTPGLSGAEMDQEQ